MAKLEQGDNSSATFKIDGLSYNKGSYEIIYNSEEVDSGGNIVESSLEVGLKNPLTGERLVPPIVISGWVDSSDTPYASLSDLLLDIGNFCITTHVELSQAEYDALTPVEGVVYYITS